MYFIRDSLEYLKKEKNERNEKNEDKKVNTWISKLFPQLSSVAPRKGKQSQGANLLDKGAGFRMCGVVRSEFSSVPLPNNFLCACAAACW
jgi:hypothetical protein